MKSKVSHIEAVRKDAACTKMLVQNLLGWDDLQYSEFQQEMGLAYLKHHFGEGAVVDRIPEHREFWGWWKQHWTKREHEFLDLSSALFKHELEDYYRDMNDPTQMAYNPHGIILDNTYERMMSQLIKNATRKEANHE